MSGPRRTPLAEREHAPTQGDGDQTENEETGGPRRDADASVLLAGLRRRVARLTQHLSQGQRNAVFMLGVLLIGALTVLGLQQWGNAQQGGHTATNPQATSTTASTTASTSGSPQTRPAQAKEFFLPDQQPGLMYPVLDAQGNLWMGEMSDNALARLNTHTGVVTTWAPPHGENNIMITVIDSQGRVWFTEQAANYIGRFDPATQRFTSYPLPAVNGQGAGPMGLAFDAAGKLWFTETNTSRVGRLDPATGVIQTWSVPRPPTTQQSLPYELTITPDGMIWYGYLTGGSVGRFDPATQRATLYRTPDPDAQILGMTSDAQGHVWFTELNTGKIGEIDSASGVVREFTVPNTLGNPANLYGIATTHDGGVWFASAGANAAVRYIPATNTFTFYQLARQQSTPYGLTSGPDGRLWLTTDGSPANYVAAITP
ncbi:MAG: hypothetical protein ABI068_03365 [Ktedonobacterales bacterium]